MDATVTIKINTVELNTLRRCVAVTIEECNNRAKGAAPKEKDELRRLHARALDLQKSLGGET